LIIESDFKKLGEFIKFDFDGNRLENCLENLVILGMTTTVFFAAPEQDFSLQSSTRI
jgi:hypothetical protein